MTTPSLAASLTVWSTMSLAKAGCLFHRQASPLLHSAPLRDSPRPQTVHKTLQVSHQLGSKDSNSRATPHRCHTTIRLTIPKTLTPRTPTHLMVRLTFPSTLLSIRTKPQWGLVPHPHRRVRVQVQRRRTVLPHRKVIFTTVKVDLRTQLQATNRAQQTSEAQTTRSSLHTISSSSSNRSMALRRRRDCKASSISSKRPVVDKA